MHMIEIWSTKLLQLGRAIHKHIQSRHIEYSAPPVVSGPAATMNKIVYQVPPRTTLSKATWQFKFLKFNKCVKHKAEA